jgi:hypothetical protein
VSSAYPSEEPVRCWGSTGRPSARCRAADDEAALTESIVDLARQYGRYGYRRITALLRTEGWRCNQKRVERIWRAEGLKVPARQPKRGRLWLNDGSCVRLRPERPNHVWAYDFVEDRTRDGRKLKAADVIDVLSDLFILRGMPSHVRSDNEPEFAASAVSAEPPRACLPSLGLHPPHAQKAMPENHMIPDEPLGANHAPAPWGGFA